MTFQAAKCPSCGEELRLPTERERVKCMYCGVDISVAAALSPSGANVESMIDVMLVAVEAGNHEETVRLCDSILEMDSKCAEAWLYKGLALTCNIDPGRLPAIAHRILVPTRGE